MLMVRSVVGGVDTHSDAHVATPLLSTQPTRTLTYEIQYALPDLPEGRGSNEVFGLSFVHCDAINAVPEPCDAQPPAPVHDRQPTPRVHSARRGNSPEAE